MHAMARLTRIPAVVALVLGALVVAGCDGGGEEAGRADTTPTPPTTTTTTDGTTTPAQSSVAVYFLRDGKVSPVRRTVAATPAVARAAITALLQGPTEEESTDGLSSAIPEGTELRDIALSDGVATVDLGGSFDDGGGSASMLGRVAQVVATLTRFPSVERVAFRVDGEPVETIGGEGVVVDPPLGRAAIEDETPQILVESPLPGDTVTSPVRLRGTANVFEATVSIDVRDAGGKLLKRTFTTATSGNGTRGTFDTTVALPGHEGVVTVVAYEASAKDGTPLHVVRVPLVLSG
jgi:sporulation and spore germination protein/immunoglobulin-like protein involved in spore germination